MARPVSGTVDNGSEAWQSSYNMARPGAYLGDGEVGSCLEGSREGRSWIQGPSLLNLPVGIGRRCNICMLSADAQTSSNPGMARPLPSLSLSPYPSLVTCRETPVLFTSVGLGSIWFHVLENTTHSSIYDPPGTMGRKEREKVLKCLVEKSACPRSHS